MKREIIEYISSFKNILKLIILFNLLFLITYKVFLHSTFNNFISGKEDPVDIAYYTSIFSNLDYAIIIVIVLVFLILRFYKSFRNVFNKPSENFLFFCIVITIIVQFILLFLVTPTPISDSKHYIDQANLLYKAGSYVNSTGNLTAFWPVGLPSYLAFLKSFSPHFLFIAKLINILFSVGLILICYFIFKNYLNKSALNIFLIIFTFFPNNLFSSNIILTDYPFLFFLWASILMIFVLKNKQSIWVAVFMGIFCALGSFLRPIGIALTIILFMILFFRNYPIGIKYSMVMLTVFLLILLPWGIRNFNIFHSIVPVSTNEGYIFLMGNHEESSGGVNFKFEYDFANPNETKESCKAYNKAFSDIISNPIQSIIRIPKKIIQTYYRGDSSITWGFKKTEEYIPGVLKSLIFYATNLIFYIIILINIYIIFLSWKRINFKKYTELIVVSIFIILIIITFVGSERYLIPLLPVHIFLVAKYFDISWE